MDYILNLDYQIFQSINSLAGKWQILDYFGILCAKYLIFVIAGAIIGWWISMRKTRSTRAWPFEGKKKWLIFSNLSLAVLFSILINYILGFIKFRTRPFINFNITQLINPLSEKSFPSDHTAVVFAASAAVFFYNKKLGLVLLFLSFLVGLARIYVGVHYPLDVLGGMAVGIFSAVVFNLIFKRKS